VSRPPRNRRRRPGERILPRSSGTPGTGPLSEWAVEVVVPTVSLIFGVALLFLLFLF
jgi:hypothetical protein